MSDYPDVRRVFGRDGYGRETSYIEPPLDHQWPNLQKLRWCAAVVSHDTGLVVLVHEMQGSLYSVQVDTISVGGMPYQWAWDFMSAVNTGALAMREKIERESN